jgi:type IV pilus assembly protein PilO
MAALDSFERFPIWQRILLFVLVSVAIVAGWWFLYYEEAVAGRASAKAGLDKAVAELETVTAEREKFLQKEKQTGEVEAELQASMEVLPMSTAAVDNLMQVFQQQARLVGLTVEAWTPAAEEKLDYYARLPVKVKASGTWAQAGEFFRRVSELDRPVSIEGVKLTARDPEKRRGDTADASEPAVLDVEFEVTTYRFLPDEERAADAEAAATKNKKKPQPAKRKK